MKATLNLTQQELVDSLPEALRAQVAASILEEKQRALDSLNSRMNTFSVSLSSEVQESDGNGKPKRDANGKPVMKPGKGGFKVTGLGSRFPVTLYPEQWEVIFANVEKIRACYNDPANAALSKKLRDPQAQ